jgi:formylglycine-generating enzyme required for sulfatase activity
VVCWDRHCRPPQDGSGQRALPWAVDEQESAVKLRSRQLHDVLRLVSPAIRIERGFLRDVRFLLDHTAADAGTEYDAFQCPDTNGSGNGFSLVPARQRQLRAELGQAVPPPLLAGMLRLLGHHHTYSASIFGAEELEGLKEALPPALWPLLEQSGLLTPDSESQAALHWRQIAAGLLQGGFGRHQEAMKGYAMRGISRVEGSIADSAAKQVIWALNHPDHQGEYPGYVAPLQVAFLQKRNRMPAIHAISFVDGLRVGAVSPHDKIPVASLYTHQSAANVQIDFEAHDWPRKLLWNWQDVPLLSGDELSGVSRIRIDAGVDAVELGKLTRPAWASRMWHENAELKAQFTFKGHNYLFERSWAQELVSQFLAPMGSFYGETGWQLSEWTCKSPPKWATRLWADDYGLAAEFHIRSVPFTLRWIPPGSFLMGSPEGEPGRQKNEGPQHRVTISKGYWMAETPVTQAQWRAVVEAVYGTRAGGGFFSPNKLNRSPSHYKGPAELPVEQVSWEDSTAYCRLLNALLPDGPGFHLPTEAQWEYACRAGTDTAFNDGSGCTLPSGKDPALDRLGWFGDNSGSQTHPVKQKLANRNGLHDMHGNVWEWCADAWYDYSAESATNPRHDGEKGANRVLRGGSWVSHARYCRAAYRCGDRPGARWFGPGLRLAAGQEQAEPQQKERSDLPERRSRARRAGGSKPA